jgi:hypothetical protein
LSGQGHALQEIHYGRFAFNAIARRHRQSICQRRADARGRHRHTVPAASGFGIGALVIGNGGVGHIATSGPTAAQQSAATAPAAPGPAPNPEPNTGGGTVPETTGQAPAPANPSTPRAATQGQK